jgi:hypothetical protein
METRLFIGIDTFDLAEEIYIDLIDQNLLLVLLDSSKRSRKENFCFKGCLSYGLIYGHVQTNGYRIQTTILNPTEYTKSPMKWFESYSPETNSFANISNKLNESIDQNSFSNNVVDDVIQKVQFYINTVNLDQERLKEFLTKNDFSPITSSLIAITFLKSKLCNYLSYFSNFKTIYQQNANTKSATKSLDEKLAGFGVFPVSDDKCNAIHIESSEELAIVNGLLSEKNDGWTFFAMLLFIKNQNNV